MNKCIPDRKYMSIQVFLTGEYGVLAAGSLVMKWIWKVFYIFSTSRFKGEVNFFIKEFLEVFYFPSAFIGI